MATGTQLKRCSSQRIESLLRRPLLLRQPQHRPKISRPVAVSGRLLGSLRFMIRVHNHSPADTALRGRVLVMVLRR
jgi:hypothetical protein